MSAAEIWKECPLHSAYEVSSHGTVRRKGKDKPLRPWKLTRSNGYLAVGLGRSFRCTIHRLVAVTFLGLDIGNRSILVCHKDDNPENNRLENLYLGDKSTNQNDYNRLRKQRGDKHPNYVHGRYADRGPKNPANKSQGTGELQARSRQRNTARTNDSSTIPELSCPSSRRSCVVT